MYKILLCHRRKKDRPHKAFHAYWRGERARLVLNLQNQLGFFRYVQVHQVRRWNLLYLGIRASRSWIVTALLGALQGRKVLRLRRDHHTQRDECWDLVEELSYSSKQALVDALTSASGINAAHRLAEDHIPHVRRTAIVVAESFAVGPFQEPHFPRVVTMFFLKSALGMTREQMLNYWETSHKKLVVSLHPSLKYSAYNQMHVRSGSDLSSLTESLRGSTGEPFDGVAELAYGSQSELALRFLNPLAQLANIKLIRDEVHFIDHQRSLLVFGQQYCF